MTDYQMFQLVTNWINLIIIPFAIWLYRYLSNWKKENAKQENEKEKRRRAQQMAIMALLRDRILQSGRYFVKLEAIPQDIKVSLLRMGEAYADLGGNGEGHRMVEQIRVLPVDDLVIEHRRDK